MPLDQIEQASNAADQTISTSKVEVDTVQEVVPEVKQLTSDPMTEAPAKPRRKAHRLFGRKRKEEQESMSEWLGVEEDFDAKRDGQAIGSWETSNVMKRTAIVLLVPAVAESGKAEQPLQLNSVLLMAGRI